MKILLCCDHDLLMFVAKKKIRVIKAKLFSKDTKYFEY